MPHSVLPTGCKGFQGSGAHCERLVRSGSSESDSRHRPCLRTRQAHMSDFFHNWLAWLDFFEEKPEHTVRAYSQGVRRAVLFGDLEPTEFGPESFGQATLTDTVVDMRKIGGVSKATLNQTLAALKSFYDFCKSEKIPDVPDVGQIRKLARIPAESSDPEYYRPEDIRELYTEAIRPSTTTGQVRWPCRDLAMCSFLAVLGLRAAELTSAEVGWVTRERLVHSDDRATWLLHVVGKGRRLRRLPLSKELLSVNDQWQKEREQRFGKPRSGDPLFVSNDGQPFTYARLRYWLRLLNHAAGLPVRTLHSLRHTAGVQLAADGVPMNVIQSLLGHVSVTTTGIYTELAGGELVNVLDRTDANTLLGDALQGSGR